MNRRNMIFLFVFVGAIFVTAGVTALLINELSSVSRKPAIQSSALSRLRMMNWIRLSGGRIFPISMTASG